MSENGQELNDASEVNRRITKTYADAYQRSNGKFHWMGAAVFVSKQMGCNMRYADHLKKNSVNSGYSWADKALTWLGEKLVDTSNKSDDSKQLLMVGNKAIFEDIYPTYDLYEKSPCCVQLLAKNGKLDKTLARGFAKYDQAEKETDPVKKEALKFDAMYDHADYEQNIVLQQAFEKEENQEAKEGFEAAQTLNKRAQLIGLGQEEQASFDPSCVAKNEFYYKAPPSKFTDRDSRFNDVAVPTLEYYHKLMNEHPEKMQESISTIGENFGKNDLPNYPEVN
ncbi:DUF2515 family protein [Bremerella volcania]|uniref:DUF2515 family protein n=1 Tax=Bremerella volcania TaxID=2527984 RepID=UPI0011A49967|nr:hypothetical protein [Bremerella volcania]